MNNSILKIVFAGVLIAIVWLYFNKKKAKDNQIPSGNDGKVIDVSALDTQKTIVTDAKNISRVEIDGKPYVLENGQLIPLMIGR